MLSNEETEAMENQQSVDSEPARAAARERSLANLTGGSRLGKPNKVPRTVKAELLKAFDKVGGWRYLVKQAEENPTSFNHLLGRLLPQEIAGNVAANLTVLVQQLAAPVGPVRGVLSSPIAEDVFDLSQREEAVGIPLQKDESHDESST